MNCSKCGFVNNPESKFCIKCGNSLSIVQVESVTQIAPEPINNAQELNTTNNVVNDFANNMYQQPVFEHNAQSQSVVMEPVAQVQTQSQAVFQQPINDINQSLNNKQPNTNYVNTNTSVNTGNSIAFTSYFFIMLSVLLKPFTTFKEELNKFSSFKNSAILSVLISGIATIVNLLKTMLSVVQVKSYSWTTGKYTTEWVWDNLGKIEYIKVIGTNFVIYLGIMVAVAGIYYLASLIIKKQTNFNKLLGISALSIVPSLICMLVLSSILGMIWSELTIPVILIGVVYTFVLLYEGINNELLLEGNIKYYVNLICIAILLIVVYYLGMKLIIGSITDGITSGLGNIMDMFG